MTYAPPRQGGFISVKHKVASMTRDHAWQTPRGLFDELHAEFRFTVDLAASAENTLLPRFYDEAADSLLQDWSGERGFCNPPYDRVRQRAFVEKASFESQRGAFVVLLIPVRTDTIMWHEIILPYASEIRFLRGRLRFWKNGKSSGRDMAPFPSAVVVFKPSMIGQESEIS